MDRALLSRVLQRDAAAVQQFGEFDRCVVVDCKDELDQIVAGLSGSEPKFAFINRTHPCKPGRAFHVIR